MTLCAAVNEYVKIPQATLNGITRYYDLAKSANPSRWPRALARV